MPPAAFSFRQRPTAGFVDGRIPSRPAPSPLCKRSHPDPTRLYSRKITGPIITRRYQVGELSADIARPWHRNAQQHHTARSRQRRSHRQCAKIFVEGEQNSFLTGRPRQHVPISRSRRCYSDPNDVMLGGFKRCDGRAGKILVGKKAHRHAALGNTFSELSVSRA